MSHSDVFPHSEVLFGVSKEAKNLSNSAVEKQLIRCKETALVASFPVSAMQSTQLCSEPGLGPHSCQSLCRLLEPGCLLHLPFLPFALSCPSCMVTNFRQGWTPFLSCPQLHGHQGSRIQAHEGWRKFKSSNWDRKLLYLTQCDWSSHYFLPNRT